MKVNKTLIIAEAGVNHNGDIKNAYTLIKKAKASGANIIKFQTYKSENVATKNTPKANYQIKSTKSNSSQYSMIKKLQLDFKDFTKLYHYANKMKIEFMSSAFDIESLFFLKKLGQKKFKIPSGEITNLPYLQVVGSFKRDIILSTGMSDMYEIQQAISILTKSGTPKKRITVLHCHTEYPTKFNDVNLNAMINIKKKFNINVGFSDHTIGNEISIAAVAIGASIIEKHFTLNKKLIGPDHSSSLEPEELSNLVYSIRNLEKAFGSGNKIPSKIEMKNKLVVRKSIVACKFIKKGQIFNTNNLTIKRPGNGISPMKWNEVIGKKTKKDFNIDELITI